MSTSLAGLSTNFFPSAQNGFSSTLASTISSGAPTVPLNSVSGYTNGEIAVFVVDPSDATKKQTFTGVIDTSGIQVTSVVWTAGTNQIHTGGSTVVDYATATHISMMTKGILIGHNQDGTHKSSLPLTSPVITSPSFKGTLDGWIDANETWTYLLSNLITVPTGAASKYNIGDKIKLTQTTVKYFVIIGVADTILTVTGGTSYTLANAAITGNYYSHADQPLGFPAAFAYTITGWTGVTADFTGVARFWTQGRQCTYQFTRGTNQTSDSGSLLAPLPITAATVASMQWIGMTSKNVDGGSAVATAGVATIDSAATTVQLAKDAQPNGWTASGSKGANFFITYEF